MKFNNEDILSYLPDLNIYSRPGEEYYEDIKEEENIDNVVDDIVESANSTVIEEFKYNSPSKTIDSINEVIDYIDNMELPDYDDESNKNIEELVKDIKNEISNVKDQFIKSVYGKDVEDHIASDIDNAIIEKIIFFEEEQKYGQINYFSIFYDTQISYLIKEYASKILDVLNNLNFLPDESDYNTKINNKEIKLALFNDRKEKNDVAYNNIIFKNLQSLDNIINSLKSVFKIKEDTNLYMDTFSSLFTLGDESEFINDIKKEKIEELDNSIENLYKSIVYSCNNKEDIVKIIENNIFLNIFFKNDNNSN